MKYYVIINGNSSLNIQGLAIESLPNISKPLIRTSREEIDGRDGDIITKLGYSAYDKTLNIGLWGNYDINEVITFFNQEGVITFSNEPDKYYKFTIVNRIDFVNELEKFKKASITIHCQPFKYQEQPEVVAEEEAVELTGTSFNITDSLEAPLLMDLKGNTSQYTLSGKNLFDNSSTTWVRNNNSNYSDTDNLNTTRIRIQNPIKLEEGKTYTISGIPNGISLGVVKFYTNNSTTDNTYVNTKTFTVPTGRPNVIFQFNGENFTDSTNTLMQNADIQVELGNQATSYEPYCGGVPSPNPSYPQNVNVVSGDNNVIICGKNLFDKNSTTASLFYNVSTGEIRTDVSTWSQSAFIGVSNNNYTLYTTYTANTNSIEINEFDKDKQWIKGIQISLPNNTYTFTPSIDTRYIRVGYRNDRIDLDTLQLEKGSTATTYTPYTGTTYNINLPVENLFDISTATLDADSITNAGITLTYNSDGTLTATGTNNATYRNIRYTMSLSAGTYYFSGCPQGGSSNGYSTQVYDGSTYYSDLGDGSTFTLNSTKTIQFILIRIGSQTITFNNTVFKPMITKIKAGYEAYTPYGTTPIELCKIGTYQDYFYKEDDKWYLHKEVGKVVLDGSEDESWSKLDNSSYSSTILRFRTTAITNVYKESDNTISIISDYFKGELLSVRNKNSIARQLTDVSGINIFIDKNYLSGEQTSNFKTWLGTHNVNVKYVLATPTNTEITYQPLLNQLNTLEDAESYEGITNINQVNNDLPFILGLTYFTGDNTITITNDGNIYSKPLLRIKGTSDISISLNGIQIFQITLQNNEIIIIDTEKMEAYYDGILKNRQVIGDYNNFKLNPGENTIEFNGAFDYVRISRYSRWV